MSEFNGATLMITGGTGSFGNTYSYTVIVFIGGSKYKIYKVKSNT